jgi:hypothetical protein
MIRYNKPLPVEPRVQEDRPIDELDKVYSKLMSNGKTAKVSRAPGLGAMLAAERARDKRVANREIPSGYKPTRQQRRREAILRERQLVTVAKAEVARRKIKGGSARIRTSLDADALLS